MTRQRWLLERVLCSRPGGLADAWDAAWDRGAEGAEFAADDDVEALKASGARLTHKYLTEAVPAIEPAAVEVPVSGKTAGIAVRGIADIVTMDGTVIDIKTASSTSFRGWPRITRYSSRPTPNMNVWPLGINRRNRHTT